ncbi:hypothetical protein [Spiroplasma floricola]|uniref:Polymerase/histidinol phosphatase N-terminal domain-containing protein n=1 Tax=Spiroplasma floricola 23-6 TaxID=1336749 RepID=A0A2K8SCV7_9MOLU|nr:hypothetical protein [Spiroplasma floricola]AUB31286.1 hypothetical protein SFLOR_v1c02250 [Spiroplasma floricola 23-6]
MKKNNYSEWNIFDLHLHSPLSKNDSKNKDMSLDEWTDKLIDKLEKNNIKLVSVTDHDLFLIDLYEMLNKKILQKKLDISFIPGVELNVLPTENWRDKIDKDWQILVYFNPDNINDIDSVIKDIIKTANKNFEVILQNLEKLDCIIVGEGSKSNGIFSITKDDEETSEFSNNYVKEYGTLGVLWGFNDSPNGHYATRNRILNLVEKSDSNFTFVNFSASDNHDINEYLEEKNKNNWKLTYFKALPTFMGLKFALSNQNRISEVKPTTISRSSKLKSVEFKNKSTIQFSEGLNILIGPRSSGKTFLNTLLNALINNDKEQFKKDDYKDEFSLLGNEAFIKDFNDNKFNKPGSSMLIEQSSMIEKAYDLKTKIIEDFDYNNLDYSNFDELNKKNKDYISNLTEMVSKIYHICNTSKSPFESLEIIDDNIESVEAFKNKIMISINDEINDNFYNEYESLKNNVINNDVHINKLKKNLKADLLKIKDIEIQKNTFKHFNLNIENANFNPVKDEILKQIDVLLEINQKTLISINSNAFFPEFIKIIKSIYTDYDSSKSNNLINKDLKIAELKDLNADYKKFGEIVSKFKNSKLNFQDQINEQAIIKSFGAHSTFIVKQYTKHTYKENLFKNLIYTDFLDIVKKNDSISIEKYKLLLKYSIRYKGKCFKQEKTDKQINVLKKSYESIFSTSISHDGIETESSSPGMRAQIVFLTKIDDFDSNTNKNILFIDQPEDSIDNAYVSKEMVEILKNSSRHKQVFLITHNSNLVVNLDPENIIVPTRESDGSIKYQNGAMESEIYWKNGEKKMISIIADEVEGGLEALNKRISKYEIGGIKKNEY